MLRKKQVDIRELTSEEFQKSFGQKMIDVTASAPALVDIWPYVNSVSRKRKIPKFVLKKRIVEYVYRGDSEKYEHVLVPIATNVYLVVVVDIGAKAIAGHHVLDLIEKYGLEKKT